MTQPDPTTTEPTEIDQPDEGGSIQDPSEPNLPEETEPAPTEQPAVTPPGTGVTDPPA